MNDEKEIIELVGGEVALVSGMQIKTSEDYDKAGAALVRIKGMTKTVKEYFAPMVDSAFKAHKAVKARENEALAPLEKAEHELKTGMQAWYSEQERIRREAEARATAERRKAEEDAEKARQEAIMMSELSGEEVPLPLANPSPALTVAVPEPVKTAGVSMVETWGFEITDAAAIPREFLVVDETKIRRVVAAMKGDTNIPGVKIVKGFSARGRA